MVEVHTTHGKRSYGRLHGGHTVATRWPQGGHRVVNKGAAGGNRDLTGGQQPRGPTGRPIGGP